MSEPTDTLTPGQVAARKAVATRQAREAAALDQQARRYTRDIDAILKPCHSGSPGGYRLHISGVVFFYPSRQAALDFARGRYNVVED